MSLLTYYFDLLFPVWKILQKNAPSQGSVRGIFRVVLERKTRLELATLTLAR